MRHRTAMLAAALVLAAGGCGGGDDDAGTRQGGAETQTQRSDATTQESASTSTSTEAAKPKPKAPPEKAIGIGDQNAAFFAAPAFRALKVDKARRVVPWDVMRLPDEQKGMSDWLAAAKQAGVEPLVTFGASRTSPKKLPSVAEFRSAFEAFHKRFPQVRVYAPWNEINHKSQPTADHPDRAAAYYEIVRDACEGCTVLAADVLDQAGFTKYVRRFKSAVDGAPPRLWGLHNYSDTNRFRTKGTRAMLRAVDGDIWVTETGGVARFGRSFPYDLQRQARATAYTFKLLDLSPRIRRLYLYNWTGSPPGARFDAGLTNPDGSPRPAYRTLQRQLQ